MPRKIKLQKRNEKIFDFCESGVPFAKVAAKFDLSVTRVRKIYYDKKTLIEKWESMPPLQKMLSPRSQNRLGNYFGEDIFDHPQRIVDFGVLNLGKIKNVGIKVMGEISKALYELDYIPVDEVKIWLADWRRGHMPARSSTRRQTKNIMDQKINQKPHLGDIILKRYSERLLSGFEDLKQFDLIDQLKKPVLSFSFYGSKRIILEIDSFLERFQYFFIIFTKSGYDICSLPDRGNRNAKVYISRFPKLIKFIKENENNISDDLWGLLYGYPLDEIYDFLYRKGVVE